MVVDSMLVDSIIVDSMVVDSMVVCLVENGENNRVKTFLEMNDKFECLYIIQGLCSARKLLYVSHICLTYFA